MKSIDECVMEDLTDWVALEEGFRSEPYRDTLGVWTIGYGYNLTQLGISKYDSLKQVKEKVGSWGEKDAYRMLVFLLEEAVDDVLEFLERDGIRDVPDVVVAALTNMSYQLGLTGLKKFKKTLASIALREYNQASVQILKSLWASQTPNRAKRVSYVMSNYKKPGAIKEVIKQLKG